ncbi:hypothetical protein DUNSADRAFT_4863 [Dunaliella salina]|uniref:Encoded protein n=1 Tax=Dunaliella salina TaxID=3046 RepID=A0ABQ7GR57_DUNSA|nr:hypothetical protein DUNSADRAFT_4863 [Dunaliella salina]|eukprot:KAF5837082.1 hypothetical protein DUNSADRAFT_4863 [Dunaliella salina]
MASIRLLLPPGIECRLKDLEPQQWKPPVAPAIAIAAAPYPQYIHVMVSAPSSLSIESLRFMGLSWGQVCVLDVTVDIPFGGSQTTMGESETTEREEMKAWVTDTSLH